MAIYRCKNHFQKLNLSFEKDEWYQLERQCRDEIKSFNFLFIKDTVVRRT